MVRFQEWKNLNIRFAENFHTHSHLSFSPSLFCVVWEILHINASDLKAIHFLQSLWPPRQTQMDPSLCGAYSLPMHSTYSCLDSTSLKLHLLSGPLIFTQPVAFGLSPHKLNANAFFQVARKAGQRVLGFFFPWNLNVFFFFCPLSPCSTPRAKMLPQGQTFKKHLMWQILLFNELKCTR